MRMSVASSMFGGPRAGNPRRRGIFRLELTDAVELHLFLMVVHFRVEINLCNLERFVA